MENNMDGEVQRTDFGMTGTFKNDAARQTAVNFMPSRQLPYNTMRLRRTKSEHLALLEEWAAGAGEALDRRAELIVRGMEQHHHLMEDNPEAEELRREALRELPQGLTLKRNVRAKLSASVSLRSKKKPIPFSRRLKYRFSFAIKRPFAFTASLMKRRVQSAATQRSARASEEPLGHAPVFRDRLRNFIFSVELWYEAIRKVEGHFGSAVGSYFYFLRWLFMLNFVLTVFLVSFVVVPQILYDITPQHSRNESSEKFLTVLDFISGKKDGCISSDVREWYGVKKDVVTRVEKGMLQWFGHMKRMNESRLIKQTYRTNVCHGQGALADTPLFYGHYAAAPVRASTYHITYAYFFTLLLLYIFCFVVLCFRTAASYRRNFIEPAGATGGSAGAAFAARVFCGWDFGISTPRAATLNAHSLYNELKELLSEQEKRNETASAWTQLKEYSVNACVWACVLALMGGAQFGLWRLLVLRDTTADTDWALAVSAGLTAVLVLGPFLLNLVVKLEYYSRRGRVYVTLARALLLDASTLLLLFMFWARYANNVCALIAHVI
ncbi:Transmembrane channel-like protein 3 [Eumeta japonica]|uniref:Transmembrane channel-like protein 3 n=1 Tax=Eumeta variegata TaxID=151549 RepID=A0A4C1ZBH8_EUMVA|nr:Transmembrane channel-like protein 3 [Eumeta japonica]